MQYMFPNPVASFTYPHNSVRSKNSASMCAYALTLLILGGMCTGQEQRTKNQVSYNHLNASMRTRNAEITKKKINAAKNIFPFLFFVMLKNLNAV